MACGRVVTSLLLESVHVVSKSLKKSCRPLGIAITFGNNLHVVMVLLEIQLPKSSRVFNSFVSDF